MLDLRNKTPFCAVFLLSSLFLTACGGGDSAGNSNTPNSVNTPNTFKASFVYQNECGEAFPHPFVEVFLHDANWDIVERQLTDINGDVEFTRTEDSMNISIISRTKAFGEASNIVKIDYFEDASLIDIGQRNVGINDELVDNSICECAVGDIRFVGPDLMSQSYPLHNFPFNSAYSDFNFFDIEICKEQGNWSIKYAMFDSITGSENEFAVLATNFDNMDIVGFEAVNVDLLAEKIPLNQEFERYAIYELDRNNNFLFSNSDSAGEELEFFPDHPLAEETIVHSRGISFEDFEGLNVTFFKRTFSEEHYDVQLLVNDLVMPDFSVLSDNSISDTGEFDYSAITDFPFLWTDLSFSSEEHSVSVHHSGSTIGRLPELSIFTGYEEFFAVPELTDFSFLFFDYANLARSSNAMNDAVLSGASNLITIDNYQTHYRKDWEYVEIELDISSLDGVLSKRANIGVNKTKLPSTLALQNVKYLEHNIVVLDDLEKH
jgi:hypothetical protein